MKKILVLLLMSMLCVLHARSTETDTAEAQRKLDQQLERVQKLQYKTGKTILSGGIATLDVPKGYKFLEKDDAIFVLEDLWENMPDASVVGLLVPEGFDLVLGDTSGKTIIVAMSYSEEGYVDDSEAKDLDYDKLMEQMKTDAEEENKQRIAEGKLSVKLFGWAEKPFYDNNTHKLYWAKDLLFGDTGAHTLNYDIRILGRKGYITMTLIADMKQLPEVKTAMNSFLNNVEFNSGYTYSEFDPSVDQVAAYGVGGLIAGKVLAKAGFFALMLKGWKLILGGLIVAGAAIRRFFTGRSGEEA